MVDAYGCLLDNGLALRAVYIIDKDALSLRARAIRVHTKIHERMCLGYLEAWVVGEVLGNLLYESSLCYHLRINKQVHVDLSHQRSLEGGQNRAGRGGQIGDEE